MHWSRWMHWSRRAWLWGQWRDPGRMRRGWKGRNVCSRCASRNGYRRAHCKLHLLGSAGQPNDRLRTHVEECAKERKCVEGRAKGALVMAFVGIVGVGQGARESAKTSAQICERSSWLLLRRRSGVFCSWRRSGICYAGSRSGGAHLLAHSSPAMPYGMMAIG